MVRLKYIGPNPDFVGFGVHLMSGEIAELSESESAQAQAEFPGWFEEESEV